MIAEASSTIFKRPLLIRSSDDSDESCRVCRIENDGDLIWVVRSCSLVVIDGRLHECLSNSKQRERG
jgi:predicted molibdopterin-dependent oxidoreductase YjgC